MTVDILTETIDSNSIISMSQQVLSIIQPTTLKPLWNIRYVLALINNLSNIINHHHLQFVHTETEKLTYMLKLLTATSIMWFVLIYQSINNQLINAAAIQ